LRWVSQWRTFWALNHQFDWGLSAQNGLQLGSGCTKLRNMSELQVDIWSDIACPWCYIGKRRLEQALLLLHERVAVQVTWHSFELNPNAPQKSEDGRYVERLAKKYGTTSLEAEQMIARVRDTARADGLDLNFDVIRPGNTFDAHRLLHLAKQQGLQDTLKERFFRAYFCEGAEIGVSATLMTLATEVGLSEQRVRSVLSSEEFAADVRQDESDARELGVSGVPFFVLGGRYAVSGAQPVELLKSALEKALSVEAVQTV